MNKPLPWFKEMQMFLQRTESKLQSEIIIIRIQERIHIIACTPFVH